MSGTRTNIDVLLWWLPADGSSLLLMQRRFLGTDEFWISGQIDVPDLAILRTDPQTATALKRLLLGLHLPELHAPIAFRRAGREAAQAVRQGAPHPLVAATLGYSDEQGVVVPKDGRLSVARGEPGASALATAFREALDAAGLSRSERVAEDIEPRVRVFERGRLVAELRADVAGRVDLDDVRGYQIGDRNIQVNRFVAETRNTTVSFDEILRRDDVQAATRALLEDPENESLRTKLVDRIRDHGWTFRTEEVTISARCKDRGLLADMMAFDTRGAQIGDHNTQRNTFVYTVERGPDMTKLVRQNARVAEEFADYLCPRSGQDRDLGTLRAEVDRAVRELGVTWNRDRSVRAPLPRGVDLHITRVDGASIGRSRIEHHEEVRGTVNIDRFDRTLRKVERETRQPDRARLPDLDTRVDERTGRDDRGTGRGGRGP
jgi:hypothetical protein